MSAANPAPDRGDDPLRRDPTRHVERTAADVWQSRLQRRRDKIAEEIARNRRGEYTVPTWVLTLILVLLVGGWLALVLLS